MADINPAYYKAVINKFGPASPLVSNITSETNISSLPRFEYTGPSLNQAQHQIYHEYQKGFGYGPGEVSSGLGPNQQQSLSINAEALRGKQLQSQANTFYENLIKDRGLVFKGREDWTPTVPDRLDSNGWIEYTGPTKDALEEIKTLHDGRVVDWLDRKWNYNMGDYGVYIPGTYLPVSDGTARELTDRKRNWTNRLQQYYNDYFGL